MDTDGAAVVAVECDRCHRPGWRLRVSPDTGEVVIDGHRQSADRDANSDLNMRAFLRMTEHMPPAVFSELWQAEQQRAGRDGGTGRQFIVSADGPAGTASGWREKLICVGRKHTYEHTVTAGKAARAYHAAVARGDTSIRMRDI